jgi:rhodanese-related sulfurtransferase
MECTRIAVATIACAVVGNWLYGTRLAHSDGVRFAAAPYLSTNVGKVPLVEAVAAGSSKSCLLVDARRVEDFARGSLPNAVNIPVTADYPEIRDFLSEIPHETRIVVFCQSASCGYDEQIATMLSQLGFEDVSATEEGFAEFQVRQASSVSDSANS